MPLYVRVRVQLKALLHLSEDDAVTVGTKLHRLWPACLAASLLGLEADTTRDHHTHYYHMPQP